MDNNVVLAVYVLAFATLFLALYVLVRVRRAYLRRDYLNELKRLSQSMDAEERRLTAQILAVNRTGEKILPRINDMKLTYSQARLAFNAVGVMLQDDRELEAFGMFAQVAGITKQTVTERELAQLLELDETMSALFYAHLAETQEVKNG